MEENRTFYYALILSLLVHVAVIGYFSTKKLVEMSKPLKKIEVTYQSVKPKTIKQKKVNVRKLDVVQKEKKQKKIKIHTRKQDNAPIFKKRMKKDVSKIAGKIDLNRKLTPSIRTLEMERKITIPLFKSEKITNPKYLTYNQNIRQKIREHAYAYVDSPDFDAGKVYLTFVLKKDGSLKQIKIREDKTEANNFLREVGVNSIEESTPFPPFPKDLNYPELSFNVVISFQVNE